MTLSLLLACAGRPAVQDDTGRADTSSGTDPVVLYEPLPSTALLRRLSLDLRGSPPTLSELERVEADRAALAQVQAELLDDPRWQERFADLWAEQLLTRVDAFNATVSDVGLPDDQEYTFERAVGDEPLVLMAAIAVQDRPWTDVVTVDWTMANDTLLGQWDLSPISTDEAGLSVPPPDGWTPARYGDGRPPGGVLMTNGLWWRYWTVPSNYNRTRAAATSRLFLCEDYLLRPVSFEGSSLLDNDSLDEATRSEEACVGCHVTLDPLAAAFFGFWWFDIYSVAEMESYHPDRERLGTYYLGVEPAWFGVPMDAPADLALLLANDPRFLSCTTKRMGAALLRRELQSDDQATVSAWRDAFVEGDLRMRALVEEILASDEYQAGSLADEAGEEQELSVATRRLLSPRQLATSVEALTGFRWQAEGFDQLDNDDLGYRILAGGMDGITVTQPQEDASISRVLVLRRLAEAAGEHVAATDLALPADQRHLLTLVDDATTPADAAFTDQLVLLHRRMHTHDPSTAELAEEAQLWEQVAAASDHRTAWATLVAVLIRDPAFWVY